VQRPPLPPPLSPILPRRVDMDPLPPPLSPLRPPVVAQPAERRAAAAAPKRPAPAAKPKKAAPTASPAAEAALGRPGALPLGKGRGKAAPPPAPPPVAMPLPEPVPELSPAEAEAEAAGASVTSEVGVRGVLHDAARNGPATTAAAARGMAAATLTRNVSPSALLAGITSALRTETACADPALTAAVLELDAALARAREGGRGGAVRLLGSGAVGGFADAVGAALHGSALEAAAGRAGGGAPGPTACATVALLRARGLQDAARVFLLDVLSLGRAAGGASAALAAAVQGALQAWPGLLSGTDPLVMAAAAVASNILRDQAADSSLPLEPHLVSASVADAKQLAVEWLLRCSGDDADRDALHCAVRGLELLASLCGAWCAHLLECAAALTRAPCCAGWTWAHENIIEPHFIAALADARSDRAALAAQALAPLLLVGMRDDKQSPSLDAARALLKAMLQVRSGALSAGSCGVAHAALEVDCRCGDVGGQEFVAVATWWRSLSAPQRSRAPERLQRALRSAGLLPPSA
jgi:hypothetical protein